MKLFEHILIGSATSAIFASGALAADLPTNKAPAPPPAVSCFASFYDFIECPLTYMGVTVYGQVDMGAGWNSHASRFSPTYNNGVFSVVSKTSQGPKFQLVPNGLSQTNIGIKGREEFTPGWSLVFDANISFE
jgi:hypothetical protein